MKYFADNIINMYNTCWPLFGKRIVQLFTRGKCNCQKVNSRYVKERTIGIYFFYL